MIKKSLLLHIGAEKTGTTAIQQGLSLNRDILLKKGYYFPSSLGESNHVRLTSYALEDHKIPELRLADNISSSGQLPEYRNSIYENLRNELANVNADSVIMSNEHCASRLILLSEINRLRDMLSKLFDNITIIFYIRQQESCLISNYSTAIKTGYTKLLQTPEEFAKMKNMYDYNHIISKWEKFFGLENINIRIFDRNLFKNGDVLNDFMDKLGIKYYKPIDKNVNLSLSLKQAEFLRRINKHLPLIKDGKINNIRIGLENRIQKINIESPELASLLQPEYYGIFNKSNDEVRKRYFPELKRNIFQDTVNNYAIINQKEALKTNEIEFMYAELIKDILLDVKWYKKKLFDLRDKSAAVVTKKDNE